MSILQNTTNDYFFKRYCLKYSEKWRQLAIKFHNVMSLKLFGKFGDITLRTRGLKFIGVTLLSAAVVVYEFPRQVLKLVAVFCAVVTFSLSSVPFTTEVLLPRSIFQRSNKLDKRPVGESLRSGKLSLGSGDFTPIEWSVVTGVE